MIPYTSVRRSGAAYDAAERTSAGGGAAYDASGRTSAESGAAYGASGRTSAGSGASYRAGQARSACDARQSGAYIGDASESDARTSGFSVGARPAASSYGRTESAAFERRQPHGAMYGTPPAGRGTLRGRQRARRRRPLSPAALFGVTLAVMVTVGLTALSVYSLLVGEDFNPAAQGDTVLASSGVAGAGQPGAGTGDAGPDNAGTAGGGEQGAGQGAAGTPSGIVSDGLEELVVPKEPIPGWTGSPGGTGEGSGSAAGGGNGAGADSASGASGQPEGQAGGQETGMPTASTNITRLADGTYRVTPAKEQAVTFTFAGDILFDDRYAIGASVGLRGGAIASSFDEPALELMRSADVFMVNNEFPYTNRGAPLPDKQYTFRADPSTASWLTEMGADLVSLANNHCFDYGEEGFRDTLDTLDARGILRVGAGRNLEEAMRPAYFHVGGMTIAVVNSTQIERLDNPDTRGATAESAGVFRCFDETQLLQVIENAAAVADYVIVYIHWGTENEPQPDWLQFDRIDGMAQAGADLIVGDHPHCLQPITYTGDTMVAYSLGNYLFSSYTTDTGLLQATFSPAEKNLTALRFVPMVQQDSSVKTADGAEKERILQKMRALSPDVTIDGDGYISKR